MREASKFAGPPALEDPTAASALSKAAWRLIPILALGYLIAIILFFGIAGARLALFNTNGTATGILLSVTIINAFIAGVSFKGKSGWCSSMCPLLPLQRVYGQTPFVLVANTHCSTCVACTKNCYDFKPQVAYQADLYDPDPQWSAPRKLFASALPGFVLGFLSRLALCRRHRRLGRFLVVHRGLGRQPNGRQQKRRDYGE